MSSKGRGGRYAVGIGGGLAAGAATGASIGGPWGAVIGGAIGAGAGAIGTGINEGNISDEEEKLREGQADEKKQAMLQFLLANARRNGIDTSGTEAQLALRGMDLRHGEEQQMFQDSLEPDPNAFVGMGTNLARAAQSSYNYQNRPQTGPSVPTIEKPGPYGNGNPPRFETTGADPANFQLGTLAETPDDYTLDARRYRLSGGFR